MGISISCQFKYVCMYNAETISFTVLKTNFIHDDLFKGEAGWVEGDAGEIPGREEVPAEHLELQGHRWDEHH